MTKNRFLKVGSLVSTGALVFGITACSSESANDAAGDSSAAFSADSCPADASKKLTGDTIKLGTSVPQSGPFAAVSVGAKQMQAYFDKVNKDGGVDTVDGKKKIELVVLDDAYDPSRAFANIRKLVEQENIVGTVGQYGSSSTVASAPYMNKKCVPQMFNTAGTSKNADPKLPYTTQPSTYTDMGIVMGRAIVASHPDATLGVFFQNDDIGRNLIDGVKKGVEGSKVTFAGEEPYEPTDTTVTRQVTSLAATKADIFINAGLNVKCTQPLDAIAKTSWRPIVYTALNCTSHDFELAAPAALTKGAFQASYMMPLVGDTFPDQSAVRELLEAAGLEADTAGITSFVSAQMAVMAIEGAKNLTRIGIAESATNLKSDPLPLMILPGVGFQPGPGVATIGKYLMQPWNPTAKTFEPTGEAVDLSK